MSDKLKIALEKASLFLDPNKQGLGWPDPIVWDGRPYEEQAHDMLGLLEIYKRTVDIVFEELPNNSYLSSKKKAVNDLINEIKENL